MDLFTWLIVHIVKAMGMIMVHLGGHEKEEVNDLIVTSLKYGPLTKKEVIAEVSYLSRSHINIPPLAMSIYLLDLVAANVVALMVVDDPTSIYKIAVLYKLRGKPKQKQADVQRKHHVPNPSLVPA